MVTEISGKHSAFIFKDIQNKNIGLLGPEDEGTVLLQNIGNSYPST
jgi:hypothetical protein